MENAVARPQIMIDIETLGLRPGSVVASMAAVVFSPDGTVLHAFTSRLNIADQIKKGMTVDGDTINFWMKQSDEARQDTFGEPTELDPWYSLALLKSVFEAHDPEFVWAKGPDFDLVLLTALADKYGATVPWTHRQPRDLRTLLGLVPDYVPNVLGPVGTEHAALYDCHYQIAQLVNAKNWLKSFAVIG